MKIQFSLPTLVAVHLSLGLLGYSTILAQQEAVTAKPTRPAPAKTADYQPDRYQILNINNLTTWAREDGLSSRSPNRDNGTHFPRGTGPVVFADGFVFGARAYLDSAHTVPAPYEQIIRVGGSTYGTGTQEGWIRSSGASASAVDPNDRFARIYRIRRDWQEMSGFELERDAAESNELPRDDFTESQIQAIISEYEWSWQNWPVHLGAPFIDRNGNGRYDPPPERFRVDELISMGYDEPGIAGSETNLPADQVIWTVFNDLDIERATGRFGSHPLGLEIQVTVWGYRRSDPLGNVFFRRWRVINKGGVEIDEDGTKGSFHLDSMYVGQWTDPDVGDFSDDLVGCDPARSLAFAYNATVSDKEFQMHNLPPPAVGYDILQGPAVPSPGDFAIINNRPRAGFKNLSMTSFAIIPPANPFEDPGGGYEPTTLNWYKSLRGFIPNSPLPDEYFPHPPGLVPGPFPLAGDPTAGIGHLDGLGEDYSWLPADRRILLGAGPFQLAPGDTQEVVVAFVAGLGADRLSSIAAVKFNDRFAQSAYDFGFTLPVPPQKPELTYLALDAKILLKWGEDPNHTLIVEQESGPGYQFEGYNIYQLPSGLPYFDAEKLVKIATFDRKNGVTSILEERFDRENGAVNTFLVQKGEESGVDYKMMVSRDELKPFSSQLLVNGREYTFAITAYNYHPGKPFGIASLESEPTIITATPHTLNPGEAWAVAYGDTLPAIHTTGQSDGQVHVGVIDPTQMTGDAYRVTFRENESEAVAWSLFNVSQGQTVLSDVKNQSGDTNYIITDGMQVIVVDQPPGVKEGPDGWQDFSSPQVLTWQRSNDFDLEGFYGAIGWGGSYPFNESLLSGHQTYDVLIRYTETDHLGNVLDSDDRNFSYAYRYLANASTPAARSHFGPFIKNPEGHFSFQDFTKSVPWAAYVYDRETGEIGKRLSIGFLENNGAEGSVDGKWWPPIYYEIGNTEEPGPIEWFWIFDLEYRETPDSLLGSQSSTMMSGLPKPIALWGTVGREQPFGFSPDSETIIFVNRLNRPADEFTFQSVAPVYEEESAKADVLRLVNAFPNPYYGPAYSTSEMPVRAVTFSHLPPQAVIRIFNLAGHQVRVLEKNDTSQFFRWDLLNTSGRLVASGLFVAHVDMPELGVSKKLKLLIVQ